MAKKPHDASSRVRLVDGTLADPSTCKTNDQGQLVSENGVPVAMNSDGEAESVEIGAHTDPADVKTVGVTGREETVTTKTDADKVE